MTLFAKIFRRKSEDGSGQTPPVVSAADALDGTSSTHHPTEVPNGATIVIKCCRELRMTSRATAAAAAVVEHGEESEKQLSPYVEVSMMSREMKSYGELLEMYGDAVKTRVQHGTNHPEFNETFVLPVQNAKTDLIMFCVYQDKANATTTDQQSSSSSSASSSSRRSIDHRRKSMAVKRSATTLRAQREKIGVALVPCSTFIHDREPKEFMSTLDPYGGVIEVQVQLPPSMIVDEQDTESQKTTKRRGLFRKRSDTRSEEEKQQEKEQKRAMKEEKKLEKMEKRRAKKEERKNKKKQKKKDKKEKESDKEEEDDVVSREDNEDGEEEEDEKEEKDRSEQEQDDKVSKGGNSDDESSDSEQNDDNDESSRD